MGCGAKPHGFEKGKYEMDIMSMGWASDRHTKLAGFIFGELYGVFRELGRLGDVFLSPGSSRLLHRGVRFSGTESLIDTKDFSWENAPYLYAVEPDVLLFDKNEYLKDVNGLHYVGFPDLVVEVWSPSNVQEERDYKQRLYSTGKKTEHWYIEQDTCVVDCWYEKTHIHRKTLDQPLQTISGIPIDLTHLSKNL